jgi:hypothetical protein
MGVTGSQPTPCIPCGGNVGCLDIDENDEVRLSVREVSRSCSSIGFIVELLIYYSSSIILVPLSSAPPHLKPNTCQILGFEIYPYPQSSLTPL